MRGPQPFRRARGQAVVELVLGIIVVVTVLLFAIHFAEVGYISLKTTEAAHSAMLDATGHKLHDWPGSSEPAHLAAVQAGLDADKRYKDFDSRTSSAGGRTLTQVLTQARGMSVSCGPGHGPGFGPSPLTSGAYSDNGGMWCRAEADLTAIRLPSRFLEGVNKGLFHARHYKRQPIHVCAFGRSNGDGQCTAALTTVLDDWGLSGAAESQLCVMIPDAPLVPCANKAYWLSAASVFALSGAGMGVSGSALAKGTVGMLPPPFIFGAENFFWMSASGEEVGFVQPLPGEGWNLWPTSPGLVPGGLGGLPYTFAYVTRGKCFLGRECR